MTPDILIGQARVQALAFTNESCAVQTLTSTDNGDGSFTESWATIETVPGLVEWVDDSEQVIGGAPRGAVTHKLRLKVTPTTRAIVPSQRIVVAAREGKAQMVFTQPKRLDQSYEVLVSVAVIIDVSNPE